MPREPIGKPATLQTAERALRFLEIVAAADEPPRVREVAETLDVNLTSAYHLFNTLHHSGYLTRADDGSIRLGSQINVLYEGYRRQFSSTRHLLPLVEDLSRATRETAYLSVLSREGLVVQLQVEAEQALRVAGHGVGFAGHEHVRASGKAVMAFLPPESCSAMLDRLLSTEPTKVAATIRRRLDDEFVLIREQGWSLDREEYQSGVCCVAAPFFGADGTVAGSVSISLPAARYMDVREFVTRRVVDTARAVSRAQGHSIEDDTAAS